MASFSPQLQLPPFYRAASRAPPLSAHKLKGVRVQQRSYFHFLNSIPLAYTVPHAANMAAGHSDESPRVSLNKSIDAVRNFWDRLPQPVKSFPWNDTFYNFLDIIIQLFCSVSKYLCVPLLAITSLSEMSYCAHERKMVLVPIPLLIGFSAAGVLNDTILEASSAIKECEVPWHLLVMAIFLVLLKLPGPYYPYWGRIFIPHLANGGLWRILWLYVMWSRRQQESVSNTMEVKNETRSVE